MNRIVEIHTKSVLFDMDGVLVSSIGSVNRCWRRWAEIYEIDDAENLVIPHGTRAIDIIRSLRPDIDAEEGLRVIEDLEVADTADLQVLPGARELLASIPPERWAVVTSSTRRLLLGRLTAAGLPIPERLISAEMVKRGKPDPEPYRMGAELLGVDPADALVVEDAPAGLNSGKAAGCRVLAVLGTHEPPELSGADWITPSLTGITVELGADDLVLRLPVLA
ncbi:MAG: HAD family hydrolase [Acidobacteriaceae bacterium]